MLSTDSSKLGSAQLMHQPLGREWDAEIGMGLVVILLLSEQFLCH